MFPLSRSKESKSGDRYDSGQEKDVEENESIDGEIDVDVDVEEEDLDHGDRTFVTDTDTNRKRGTFVKILSTAALGLLTFGAFFGASYGVSTAVQRSKKNKTPENMVSLLFCESSVDQVMSLTHISKINEGGDGGTN